MNPASPTIRLRHTTSGAGPVLLMLHGVTRCGADWEPLLPALAEDWTIISLDQRGHGTSPRAESYLVTDYVADVVRFVQEETAAPVVIFGHSLGAMVAAAVAAELPDRVRGIILEDPPFHTMGNRIAGSAWQAQFTGMREAARKRGSVEEITDALADIRLPASGGGFKRLGELRDRASLAWSAQCLSQLDPEVLTPVIEGRWLDGYDFPSLLSGLRCPTLLLQADPSAGGALTDADAESLKSIVSDCQHVRFPSCGHNLHRDRPESVLRAFADFAATRLR
ncbi:MAG: alpha/beta hydrolase [Verrucomicrobiaceae bacterium]|jgi:pimeloyl-ACP methyl ester carboxylesterase|nr:alpha/beta hydrolase [Verrucomicrobiaceae bacterium]